MKKFFGLTLAALLGGFVAAGTFMVADDDQATHEVRVIEKAPSTFTSLPIRPQVDGEPLDFTQAAELTVNSVVHIQTESINPQVYNPWFDAFDQRNPHTLEASGSGVIISDDGYVVTNNHVIEGASTITLTLNDNRTYKAEVIGADPSFDLALL